MGFTSDDTGHCGPRRKASVYDDRLLLYGYRVPRWRIAGGASMITAIILTIIILVTTVAFIGMLADGCGAGGALVSLFVLGFAIAFIVGIWSSPWAHNRACLASHAAMQPGYSTTTFIMVGNSMIPVTTWAPAQIVKVCDRYEPKAK